MPEEPNVEIDAETRGWAMVGQTLSYTILVGLRHNGVISDTTFRNILDQSLAYLERLQAQHPDDQSLQVARKALEGMFRGKPQEQKHPK